MPEINADLTADAIVRKLIFRDDFSRVVAVGLGGPWSWHWEDSGQDSSNDSNASVDGSVLRVTPDNYVSYVGIPVPATGEASFDFLVPAQWTDSRPTYGLLFDVDAYAGIYVKSVLTDGNWYLFQYGSDMEFSFTPEASTWYRVRAVWDGTDVRANVWKRDDPEPSGWQYEQPQQFTPASETGEPGMLDVYWTAPYEDAQIDNVEIWSHEPQWVGYGGTQLDAVIDTPTKYGSLTASSILSGTTEVAPDYYGSVDTFTGAQTNLFSHVPDRGPMWTSGSAPQGGVVSFGGNWWAYQNGYSEMETGQHDYDLTFTYKGYGRVALYLRTDGSDAIVFVVGQTDTPGSTGYAVITEMVNGSLSYSTNRAGFSIGQSYTIRVVLVNRSASLYVDGVLASTLATARNLTATRLKLANLTASGTVIDNWNFPYVTPGTSFTIGAYINNFPIYPPGPVVPVPFPLPAESTIVIKVNGIDITDDVLFSDAEFSSQASGSPGTCRFGLKDMEYAYEFVVGQTITLEIDGGVVWGGWIQSIKRQYFFSYAGARSTVAAPQLPGGPHAPRDEDPCAGMESETGGGFTGGAPRVTARRLVIEGVDYNILFNKRFVFNKANPPDGVLKVWPPDTSDQAMIEWLCSNNLDLSDDEIDYTTNVEYVGTPNPDARGNPVGAGQKWGDAMRAIARFTGAVWYITPDKQLVYTDVDTPSSQYKLTDTPSSPSDYGYREMEILYNGSNLVNDAMIWGAGQGANRVKFKRTRDSASIAEHGLWQVGDFRGDLWRQASVDKRSNSFVYGSPQNKRGGKDDAISVNVTLFHPAFRVSQKVDFWSHVFDYNDVLPVRRMKITFPTTKEAQFDLVLSHSIDEPWNTFEYWFPPFKFDVPIIANTTIPYCPVPNPPSNIIYDGADQASIAYFESVFMDDFHREGGQPQGSQYGYWSDYDGTPVDPVIENSQLNLRASNHYITLKQPIGSSSEIILALDLTGWSANDGNELTFYPFGYISAWGYITCPNGSTFINPLRYVGQKVYVRAVSYYGRYTAMRIWPQTAREPTKWDVTGTPTVAPYEPYALYQIRFQGAGADNTYLEGVTVFGNTLSNDDKVLVGFFGPDSNGWFRTLGYEDPGDMVYGVYFYPGDTQTQLSSGANNSPYYDFSIVWGYFGPDHGSGVPVTHHQKIVSIWTTYPPVEPPYGLSPNGYLVTGKVRTRIGRSKLFDNRGDYPGWTTVLFAFCAETLGDGKPPYFLAGENPYWMGQDRKYMERTLEWDADAIEEDFSFYVGAGAQTDQGGHFRWSVKVMQPLDACRSMDSRGGPFMLANTGSVSIHTSDVKIYAVYGSGQLLVGAGHFCVPNSTGGGMEDERVCESIPINIVQMHELYRNGELWAVQLQSPYKPGTVEVMVDGLPLLPTLDFIELNPSTGVITFLNSIYSAKEVYVCYIPEENDVVEPTPPYVPPGGAPQPW